MLEFTRSLVFGIWDLSKSGPLCLLLNPGAFFQNILLFIITNELVLFTACVSWTVFVKSEQKLSLTGCNVRGF